MASKRGVGGRPRVLGDQVPYRSSFVVAEPVIDELDAIADKFGISRSEALRHAIEEYIARHREAAGLAGQQELPAAS